MSSKWLPSSRPIAAGKTRRLLFAIGVGPTSMTKPLTSLEQDEHGTPHPRWWSAISDLRWQYFTPSAPQCGMATSACNVSPALDFDVHFGFGRRRCPRRPHASRLAPVARVRWSDTHRRAASRSLRRWGPRGKSLSPDYRRSDSGKTGTPSTARAWTPEGFEASSDFMRGWRSSPEGPLVKPQGSLFLARHRCRDDVPYLADALWERKVGN
jgi:hypothetical protein